MSRFYGTLQGQAGEVTRRGSKDTGVTAFVAGWSGAVRSSVFDHEGEDWVQIELAPWKGVGSWRMVYRGPVNPDKLIGKSSGPGKSYLTGK